MKKSSFRWWYILIWIAGIIAFAASFDKEKGTDVALLVIGILIFLVPIIIWIAKASRARSDAAAASVYKVDTPSRTVPSTLKAAPKADPDPKPDRNIRSVRFDVDNTSGRDHQFALKRAYKLQQKDDLDSFLDLPSCVLYSRGTDENPGFAVYLESDRIGDAPADVCPELMSLAKSAKLLAVNYDIYTDYSADQDDLVYSCTVTCRFELPQQ